MKMPLKVRPERPLTMQSRGFISGIALRKVQEAHMDFLSTLRIDQPSLQTQKLSHYYEIRV